MTDRFGELGLLLFTVAGWALLVYVITSLPVSPGSQAILYIAGFVALAGTVALILALYYARAASSPSHPRAVALLGSGMRFAFATEFALWLQSLRLLTPAYLVFIVAGFIFVEILFRFAAGDRRGSQAGSQSGSQE